MVAAKGDRRADASTQRALFAIQGLTCLDAATGDRHAEEVVLLFLTSGPREGAMAEEAAAFDLPRRSLRRAAAERTQASP